MPSTMYPTCDTEWNASRFMTRFCTDAISAAPMIVSAPTVMRTFRTATFDATSKMLTDSRVRR